MVEIFLYYIVFGGARFFALFFIFLALYFTGKMWYHIFRLALLNKSLPDSFKLLTKKIIFTFIIIIVTMFFLGVGLEKVILNAQASKVIFFSETFLQMDKTIFGTYVPFWFQDANNSLKPFFDNMGLVIIIVYKSLPFLLSILFSALFVANPQYFYKALLSFIIMFLMGLPLWFLFPAVSPFDAYIDNVLHIQAPLYLQGTLSAYQPNEHLTAFFTSMADLNIKTDNQFFAITTMPSMHIAWALLILFFGVKIYRPMALLLVPYFFLNAIATVYLLQHYAIDIPAGLMVGIISIWIATVLANKKTPKIYLS